MRNFSTRTEVSAAAWRGWRNKLAKVAVLVASVALLLLNATVNHAAVGHAQSEPQLGDAPQSDVAQSEPLHYDENLPIDHAGEVFNASIAAPGHVAPAHDAVSTALTAPPVGVPTLSWNAIPGAARYNVQISASAGFADTIINQNTEATSYTPKEVFADGIYFWRVRAEVDRAWGNFSEPWSFRKEWSAAGQLRPVLTAPADDPNGLQVITSFSPEHFSWEPVPGAASYQLEISVSPSFNEAKPYRVTTLKPHHTPTAQFANNQYYWRVTPIDYRENAGEPSETRSFTFGWNQIPDLLTPNDDLDARFIPRFSWNAVAGASAYVIDISSEENFADIVLTVSTRNTSYTPEASLANNKDYFWRVRAVSPQKVNGPSSETRSFRTNWVQPPTLLSPPVRSINHIYPFFSWTPVAGAERYQIQIALGNSFDKVIEDSKLFNATSYTQASWPTIKFDADYFWRVRAEDSQGNTTNWSSEQSFRIVTAPPPNLIYPEPYYVPDAEGMPIHTDRTVAHPIFVWDTTHEYLGGNGPTAFAYPDYYRLEVAYTSDFSENQIVYTLDSAGPGAAPTLENNFTNLTDGALYYWRVSPMRFGDPDDVQMAAGTVWETRIDRNAAGLPLDSDTTPDLSHPDAGFTSVETAPIMGWLPVAGAHHYRVEISNARDLNVSENIVESAHPIYPYYVPWQDKKTAMPPGTYWWRVRAESDANTPLGGWSEVRHFFVTDNLMTGNPHDYVIPADATLLNAGDLLLYDPALSLVATDTHTMPAPYNVNELHVVQDRSATPDNRNWTIAFRTDDLITDTLTYALYFDVNQKEGVGGNSDPRGKPIAFDPLFLPDYIIYLNRENDTIVDATFHEWKNSTWVASVLDNLGGSAIYSSTDHAVQVVFPYATIILSNEDQFSGALALTVISTDSALDAAPQDSIPHQVGTFSSPALFSNMPVPLFPFDTPLSNPIVYHELPTLRWRMPHYNSTDGYIVQVARNPNFTEETIVDEWETYESQTGSYYGAAPTAFHSGISYNDDESYYWRIRYRHERFDKANEYDVSPWSPPMRFKLTSHLPGNPSVAQGDEAQGDPESAPETLLDAAAAGEVAYATPTFTWDRVEGAARYTIQIDDDVNMNSPLVNRTIDGSSYTALDTLADGTYYWRVAMRRSDNVLGQWTSIISFTKSSLVPTLLTPVGGTVVNNQPTFVWAATISNTDGLHIAAPRYRLQWDDNPQFSSPTSVETEATSYTPLKGQSLTDGTWFWRVAIIDGNNRRGPDSPPATFYKEYLRPATITPVQGSGEGGTISFEWTPLDGAAYYQLEIADNDAFDKATRLSTDNTRYTHVATFDPGEYYWRVQMMDRDGRPGPTVDGRFSQVPDQPIIDGPAIYMPFVLAP